SADPPPPTVYPPSLHVPLPTSFPAPKQSRFTLHPCSGTTPAPRSGTIPGSLLPRFSGVPAAGGFRPVLRALVTGHHTPSHLLPRSEEHTSELQSRENLVCRLLH